jgi:glycosyltransferase involved in cell wall biosynthesis
MAVHQLVPSFFPGDAMGQAALHFRLLLRRLGHDGQVFAGEVAHGYESLVQPWQQLSPAPDDWVFYHHGIASPLSGALMHLACRRGVVFHNITPARLYQGSSLFEALLSGRAQLAAMAPSVELALGVSDFNSSELREAGYQNVHTVPLFVEPSRFAPTRADPDMVRRLSGAGPAMLTVSRVVPHKRFEDLLALHREVLRLQRGARLWLVGGFAEGDRYYRALAKEARGIPGVSFLGRLSHAELVAAYRSASVFVSMSEHEGFGVPLLEAMACELPVVAYAAGAVTETLQGRGIAFTEKRFAALAEVVTRVMGDGALRQRLLKGQRQRLVELSQDAALERLRAVLPSKKAPSPRPRKPTARPRVAIVVQRYGDVGGGAEAHARQVAQHLAPHWDTTVLTTCAKDHFTWANEFPEGEGRDGEVRVLRFPTARPRAMRAFNQLSKTVFGRGNDRVAEERWVAEQGPMCPELMRHLEEHRRGYDGFVFFTYLYAPTAFGLPLVADRAMVVPTAHDEPAFQFDVFADVFERPRVLLCNTPEERDLIARRFPRHAPAKVVGVGVDAVPGDEARYRARHGVEGPYLLYVGRVEQGKGVGELLALHRRLPDAPTLLLAGHASMSISQPGVRTLGRIEEQDKWDGLAGALAVVVPSRYESLSLLALEAFAQGTPVLGNGSSEVVAGQLRRSGAGATYHDGESLAEGLRQVAAHREAMSAKAREFAKKQSWPKVVATYRAELSRIMENPR